MYYYQPDERPKTYKGYSQEKKRLRKSRVELTEEQKIRKRNLHSWAYHYIGHIDENGNHLENNFCFVSNVWYLLKEMKLFNSE